MIFYLLTGSYLSHSGSHLPVLFSVLANWSYRFRFSVSIHAKLIAKNLMENVRPFSAVIMQNENFSSFWWSVSFAAKFCNTSFYHLSGDRSKKRHLAFQWYGFPFVVSKTFKLAENGYEKGCTPFCFLASWPIVWIQKQWTTQGILSVYPDNVLSLSWRDPVFCSSLHCCVSPAAFR